MGVWELGKHQIVGGVVKLKWTTSCPSCPGRGGGGQAEVDDLMSKLSRD